MKQFASILLTVMMLLTAACAGGGAAAPGGASTGVGESASSASGASSPAEGPSAASSANSPEAGPSQAAASGGEAAEQAASDEQAAGSEAAPEEPASGQGGKIMIAYFSKTGATEAVARQIQELVGGDLVKIETAVPYPDDYTETTQLAQKEQQDGARPELTTDVTNMDEYGVVFLGYPIWWGKAPMAVYTFLETYDLAGKTVVPFCTSGGSQIGASIPDLNTLCAGATVLEGLTANDPEDIPAWLDRLGI